MAGVKGRSGRKSTSDEEKRLRIIEKAWDTISDFLSNEEAPLKDRVEVAAKLVVKNMPTTLEGELKTVIQMPQITIDGKPLEYNIGDKTPKDTGNT